MKNPSFFLGLALQVFISLGFAGCGPGLDRTTSKPGGLLPGNQAYDFSLLASSGKMVKLSQMNPNGYLVMVFYRGYWCGACQEQLADLKADYPKFTSLHTALVAISVDTLEESADLDRQWNFPFPLLSDPQLEAIDSYGARHVGGHGIHDIARPTVVIIDPKHVVRYKYIGKNAGDRPTDNEILFSVGQV